MPLEPAIKYISDVFKNPQKWVTGQNTNSSNILIIPSKLNELPKNKNLENIIKNAGYKENTGLYELALVIGIKEGWYKGSRSFRNNNPGNLDYSDNLKNIDINITKENINGRFAKFSTPELGVKVLIENKIKKWANGNMPSTNGNQIQLSPSWKYKSKPTIKEFFYTYAPPSENNTQLYINQIISSLNSKGFNINENTKLIEIIN